MNGKMDEMLAAARRHIEVETGGWLADHAARSGRIWCGRGCSDCCNLAVSTTFPEAREIARGISPELALAVAGQVGRIRMILPQAQDFKSFLGRYRRLGGPCPFLAGDGACAIYQLRPLACRALLSTRNPAWCAVDFADLHPGEKQAYLSSLDPAIVAFPTHYLAAPQALARDLEADLLAAMAFRFGFSVSGLLPVLVHLAREFELDAAINMGHQATLARLHESGLMHLFLVSLND